jgi:ergot alkaloid biosynthesis protein
MGHILVTGGTGKTGRRVVADLRGRQIPCVAASRSSSGVGEVTFDWSDPVTWEYAIRDVDAAYLIAPMGVSDPASLMIQFIEVARLEGVRRFVLLSASILPAGSPAMGQVHQFLQSSGAEWAVLRPSWFMENFTEGIHRRTIQEEHAIYTAAGHGRVPFISADDIASAAVTTLTSVEPSNTDFVLTGSQILSYDDVARRISEVIDSPITHFPLTFDELVARHRSQGLSQQHAQTLAFMDLTIADGAEDRTTPDLGQLTGNPPLSFDEFTVRNAEMWRP